MGGSMLRRTLLSSVTLSGVGVHSGRPCRVTVGPGEGLRFVVDGTEIPADVDCVVDTSMSTTLGLHGVRVSMVEHLLSALWGRGVTGATIEVDGPELPILDGSAQPWVDALELGADGEVPAYSVGPIVVRDGHRSARYEPGPRRRLIVELTAQELAGLGPRRIEFDLDRDDYAAEVAWARTFAYAADVEPLLAAGYGAGATPENTVIVGGDTKPRGPSEPTRHKLLDAIGDLALLGRPLLGTITLVDSGHAMHVELMRRIRMNAT
jgi:UDP-3-O-[3-hydroxymyristoyl] N-acetylglucosamine deacetylase